MLQVCRYRLYPTASQIKAIRETLERLRVLYNAALQERRDAYRKQGVSVTRAQQEKSLTEIKRNESEYTNLHTHLMQDAVTRLDRAFQAFFRRVKAGQKPGYPRFKGRGRYRSFSFKDAIHGNGAKLVSGNKRLRISGVGNVKIKLHRPIEGRIKTIGITLDGDGHFYAVFTCEQCSGVEGHRFVQRIPNRIAPVTVIHELDQVRAVARSDLGKVSPTASRIGRNTSSLGRHGDEDTRNQDDQWPKRVASERNSHASTYRRKSRSSAR